MDKGSDPNQLTGDESREEGTLKPRDFFWDSSVLYLVSVIIALSLVDGFTEFIKGSSVVCNVDDNDNVSSDYINNFCAESLPITEYLPAFIFIHGLAIAIPHYLWMANFGGQFDYFFSVVSTMDRSRDDTTGQYSQKNFNIVRQLQLSFTTYGRNFVYYLYIGKLMLQMIFAVASLVVSVVYFTDFNVIFQCPRDNSTINNNPNWPLNNDVTCIFTSLKLLFWIRIGDIFLICLVVLALVWGFAWSFGGHPVELGATEVSQFSFQSGIQIEYYVAPFSRFVWCQKCLSFLLSSFPWRFRSPGISTDLDFMLLKLYRTNAGLGQVFKEVQIDLRTHSQLDSDQEILTLHNNKHNNRIPLKIPEAKIDVQWTFDLNDGSPFRSFTPVDYSHMITVPNTVRGAVLGLGSFAPNNIGALYISFGQSGIALALSRVFQRVGSINFTKHKKEIDKEDLGTAADKLIDLQLFLTSHVSVTMPENILSLSLNYNINVLSSIAKIWEVIMRRGAKEIRKPKKTSYLVMGPMVTEEQGITATLFLQRILINLEENCFLVMLRPVKISGKNTKKEFIEWEPPESFMAQRVSIQTSSGGALQWPPKATPKVKGEGVEMSSTDETANVELAEPLVAKKDSRQNVKLSCGSKVMLTKFEIATYVYRPKREEETKLTEGATPLEETIKDKEGPQRKVTNEEREKLLTFTAEIH